MQPEIFHTLERQVSGKDGEVQITDAMKNLMQTQAFYGVKFDGTTFDCGSILGLLSANIAFAMVDEKLGNSFRAALKRLVESEGGNLKW